MDTILIIILISAVIGVSAFMLRDKKKGGCSSCPYNTDCSSKESCSDNIKGTEQ